MKFLNFAVLCLIMLIFPSISMIECRNLVQTPDLTVCRCLGKGVKGRNNCGCGVSKHNKFYRYKIIINHFFITGKVLKTVDN